MADNKISREFIIGTVSHHELHFISRVKRLKVLNVKGVSLAGVRTFHIHYFHNALGDSLQRTFPAGLEQYVISRIEKTLHQRDELSFLQHRLTPSDLNQPPAGTQVL